MTTDTGISADLERHTAANLQRILETGPDLGAGYRRAAANTLRDLEERARTATRRETAVRGWGEVFVTSDAWRRRSGYVTVTSAVIASPVEERVITTADLGHAPELPGVPPLFAPIANRCDLRRAQPATATTIRWSGPIRPPVVPEGQPKPSAGLVPAVTPIIIPTVAFWVGVSRAVLDDNDQLRATIDGRLRNGLLLALDDQVSSVLAADPDVTGVSGDSLGDAILVAVGALAGAGYGGNVTVLVHPADLPAAGNLAGLAVLGVGAVLPAAGLTPGTAICADLRSAVQVRYAGDVRILTTDSHAEQFLSNELVLLAEMRAGGYVTDPAAAVAATAGA